MLDGFGTLPKDTEDAAVERTGRDAMAAGLACFAPWSAAGPFGFAAQRRMAATMMAAPMALASANIQSARRAGALMSKWREEASRSRSVDALIDVNRRYGERAIALGAGEMWRALERSVQMGQSGALTRELETARKA